jgi:hypothetical protein
VAKIAAERKNQVGTGDDDLHLVANACVNAGDASALPADKYDLDGDGNKAEAVPFDAAGLPRVVNAAVDIGAYESLAAPTTSATAAATTMTAAGTTTTKAPTSTTPTSAGETSTTTESTSTTVVGAGATPTPPPSTTTTPTAGTTSVP